MKKLLGLTLAFAALLVMVGCDGEVTLDAPDVTYTVTDEGATLTLTAIISMQTVSLLTPLMTQQLKPTMQQPQLRNMQFLLMLVKKMRVL